MPTSAADVLILLAAVIGSGSMVGVGMWLYYRVKRLEAENEVITRLTENVDALRDQLLEVRETMGELHERVDFAERMLTQGREKRELPRG